MSIYIAKRLAWEVVGCDVFANIYLEISPNVDIGLSLPSGHLSEKIKPKESKCVQKSAQKCNPFPCSDKSISYGSVGIIFLWSWV